MHSLVRFASRFSFIAIACLLASVPLHGQPASDAVIDVPVNGTFRVTVPSPKPHVSEFQPATAPKPGVAKPAETAQPQITPDRDVATVDTSPVSATTIPADIEQLVVITGPNAAEPNSYFIVSVLVPPTADDVQSKVVTTKPEGASDAIELLGKRPGELVYLFQQVKQGRYTFHAAAQISLDKAQGFDPHDDDELVVEVAPRTPVTPTDPSTPSTPATPTTDKATAVTYVYEKDETAPPSPVRTALNRLNRERHILATMLEADTKDGTGDVPEQYKVPLAAAKKAGLPALVVTAGDKVLSIVNDPKSEQAVLDAVK